jgi:pimeloyl-ACP methyl ester carboxylesterase
LIDQAGHFVHFDQPAQTNSLIEKFLHTNNH